MNKNDKGKSRSGIFRQPGTFLKYLVFGIRNINYLKMYRKAFQQHRQVKTVLMLDNRELGKLSYKDAVYQQRIREFNQAMIELTRGRWYATRAMETRAREDWDKAFQSFGKSQKLGEKLCDLLHAGVSTPIVYEPAILSSNGTEILFADGVPLVPEINPVVILQGSDYDLGYQYAQQLIQVFGLWILQQKAKRTFTEAERGVIREWEQQLKEYAPEILGMCEGWAAGATDAGVPMTYDDVLELWTGCLPPAADYFGIGEFPPRLRAFACSGAAAWGRATVDGKLVTGSAGDHDCTYMVTIVAFPETGNNFIHTVFGATGDVSTAGQMYMMGHPGMNNKGLAYVEHGGEARMIEPKAHWGYGIRRGASVFHILRFANNAKEAREMELSYPVGDIGRPMGSVGGFYADSTYGYVMESRKDPVAVREAGLMGETDFLYANNSALHPDANKAVWMQKEKANWAWDPHGGWHPIKFVYFTPFSRGRAEAQLRGALNMMYHNSYGRNLYLFDMLNRGVGKIDVEYMKMLYRQSGTVPPGSWEEITGAYKESGRWGDVISTGNPSNALVAIMKPDNGDEGIYALCVGTAARGQEPTGPDFGNPIYGETNAFWELKLSSSPAGVAAYARQRAQEYADLARSELAKLQSSDVAYGPLKDLLSLAQSEVRSGESCESAAKNTAGNESIYNWARATRAFTRAQIRALQVYQALVPPSNKPVGQVNASK